MNPQAKGNKRDNKKRPFFHSNGLRQNFLEGLVSLSRNYGLFWSILVILG
jgi:hypothetical protein